MIAAERKRLAGSLLASLLLTTAWAGYRFRDRLSAMEWHLVHGNFMRVGNYEIPVPASWLVFHTGRGNASMRPIDPSTGVLEVNIWASSPVDVEGWARLQKIVLEKSGVEQIEEIQLKARQEQVECVGGDEFKTYSKVVQLPRMPSVVMECRSPNGLSIEFSGEPSAVKTLSEIVASVHRVS